MKRKNNLSSETGHLDDIRTVAEGYMRAVAGCNRGHYIAADRAEARGRVLGILSAVLGAIVGTSIFATIEKSPSADWRIVTGFLAVGAAVLATMQTFLDYAKRASAHQLAGAAYARLRREFDDFFLEIASTDDRELLRGDLSKLRQSMNKLGEESPLLPPSSYQAGLRQLSNPAVQASAKAHDG